jgi:hypothetical protein
MHRCELKNAELCILSVFWPKATIGLLKNVSSGSLSIRSCKGRLIGSCDVTIVSQ